MTAPLRAYRIKVVAEVVVWARTGAEARTQGWVIGQGQDSGDDDGYHVLTARVVGVRREPDDDHDETEPT